MWVVRFGTFVMKNVIMSLVLSVLCWAAQYYCVLWAVGSSAPSAAATVKAIWLPVCIVCGLVQIFNALWSCRVYAPRFRTQLR